jgi:hypothetical protein
VRVQARDWFFADEAAACAESERMNAEQWPMARPEERVWPRLSRSRNRSTASLGIVFSLASIFRNPEAGREAQAGNPGDRCAAHHGNG